MYRWNVFLLVVVIILGCGADLNAESTAKKVITVGVYDNPPAVYRENGQIKGFFPDIFGAIGDQIGVRFEYVWGPWDSIFDDVIDGKIDMIYDIARTRDRETFLDFNNETVFISWGVLYSRPDLKISSLLELAGKRIAVVKGDVYYEGHADSLKPVLDSFNIVCTYVETADFTEAVKATEDNRADVCVLNRTFADYNAKNIHLVQTPIIFKPIHVQIAFTRGSMTGKALIPHIDAALSKMKLNQDSVYFTVMHRYFTNYAEVEKLPAWIWKAALGVLACLLAVFVLAHNLLLRRTVKLRTQELELTNRELKEALANVKTLSGLLPMCVKCKKIRNDQGFWEQVEHYLAQHTDIELSHGLCQECADALYGNEDWYKTRKQKLAEKDAS